MIKTANVNIEANGKEIPVSALTINTAFDSFSNIFKIVSPLPLDPYINTKIKIFINKELFLTGVVLKISTSDAQNFTIQGKTLGWFLERNVYSPQGIAHNLKNLSLLDLSNKRAAKFGLKFEANESANDAVNSLIGEFMTGDEDTVADVITKCGQEKGVYCRSELGAYSGENGEIITFYGVNSLGKDIFDLDGESDEIPFEISQINYNNDSLFSTYYGISAGKKASIRDNVKREYSQSPYFSEKIVKSAQNTDADSAIDTQLRKDYISALSISLNFPFILHNNFHITAGDCFNLTSKNFKMQKRNFFITEAVYNFTPSQETTTVSACLSSARFGLLE
jgi:hypothetical protein